MAVDLMHLSTFDILNLWGNAGGELKRRDIVRTRNIVGDVAEAIGHEHCGGLRADFSGKGWDVKTSDGERVQINGLWRTSPQRTKVSAIRDHDYDTLLVIVFAVDFHLEGAYRTTRDYVERTYPLKKRINGRQPTITKKFRADPEVETVDVSAAYEKIVSTSLPLDQV